MKESACVACWLSLRNEINSEMRRYDDIYIRLASVCNHFYQVITDKHEWQIIRRTLKGLSPFTQLTLVKTISL